MSLSNIDAVTESQVILVEAAIPPGGTAWQILWKVQMPLAFPESS